MTSTQIKQIRTTLGLSQADLAAKLGCRKATISDWERGRKAISPAYGQLLKMISAAP